MESLKSHFLKLVRAVSPEINSGENYSRIMELYYRLKPYVLCSDVEVTGEDFSFSYRIPEDGYAELIREKGIYEPGVTKRIKQYLGSDSVFWNIGAYAGYFTMLAVQFIEDHSQIHSFEPYYVFNLLKYNTRDFPELHNNRFGLSDTNKDEFRPLRRGDNYARKHGAPSLIKIDVDGQELRALKGMEKTLENEAPVILSEVFRPGLQARDQSPEDVENLLRNHDYTFRWIDRFRHFDFTVEDIKSFSEVPDSRTDFMIEAIPQ